MQEKLRLLADDALDNNESLLLIHPKENVYFSELVEAIKPLLERNKDIFLDKNAQSVTSRFNYPHIYNLSIDESNPLCHIVKYLIVILAGEKQKRTDDYVQQLLDSDAKLLPRDVALTVSKEGLVDLSRISHQTKLLDHAIDLLDGRRIYLHQFLRRHFSANFVDTPRILNFAIQQSLKVEVRVDPFRIGDMSRYRNIIECDTWFGPGFSQRLLNSRDKLEKVTKHHFNGDNHREKLYNQYITFFRTSMLDFSKGLRQFFIEEYPPYLDSAQFPMPGVSEKYVLQRFAHFVYNQNNGSFEHIDCAVRIFNRDEYDKLYEEVSRGRDPGGKVGKRFKLFKISSGIDNDLVMRCLYSFFRYNIRLQEYFNNLTFREADDFLCRR